MARGAGCSEGKRDSRSCKPKVPMISLRQFRGIIGRMVFEVGGGCCLTMIDVSGVASDCGEKSAAVISDILLYYSNDGTSALASSAGGGNQW